MPYADVNGMRLYYEDSGSTTTSLPIVLSHGFFMDHDMFDPQLRALRGKHRVITWDQRGHGRTDSPGEGFTYWDSARDCLALLDHLGVDRAVWGGMSQGGFLSLRAALLAPSRVAGLVLIDTQAGVDTPDGRAAYEQLFERWLAEGPVDDLVETIAGLILNQPEESKRWIARWQERYAGERAADVLQASRALLTRDDITDRLSEIACPALVVHGTADPAIDVARGAELCAGLSGCVGVVPVEGAAHASNLTHPEPVNTAVRDFLDQLQ